MESITVGCVFVNFDSFFYCAASLISLVECICKTIRQVTGYQALFLLGW